MTKIQKSLVKARDGLADTALISFAIADLIIIPASIIRNVEIGLQQVIFIPLLLWGLTILAALNRHRLSFNLKAGGLIVLVSIGVLNSLQKGLVGEASFMVMISSILAVTFFSVRASAILLSIGASLIYAKGAMISSGQQLLVLDPTVYYHSIYTWLTFGVGILGFGFIVTATQGKMLKLFENALIDAKTLSGLLPICSSCKKIRDDEGYWSRIEHYITERSEAEFTHGICQECATELYPEIDFSKAE